jgi:hypothetical protein
MASFKKMFLGASLLTAFAVVAAAAPTATVLPTKLAQIRGEGITEALTPLTVTIAGTAGNGAISVDIALTTSGNIAITSPIGEITTTTLVAGVPTAVAAGTITIVGGTITFHNVPLTLAANTTTFTINGLKVNASGVGAGALSVSGLVATSADIVPAAQAITTGFLGNPVISIGSQQVATVALGLKVTLPSKAISAPVNSGDWNSPSGFDQTKVYAVGDSLFQVDFTPTSAATILPNDRVIIKITNIPAGLALYVPTTIATTGGSAVLQVATDNNGAGGAPNSETTNKNVLVNPNGATSAVVVYVDAIGIADTTAFSVPFFSVATFPIATATDAAVISAGYAPLSTDIGHTLSTATPRFLATALTSFSGLFATTAGSSTLVFPYVVTGNGWVTGIAINNAGAGTGDVTDPTKGAAGTCALTFYSVDGTVTAPATVTTPSITPGGTQAFLLGTLLKDAPYSGLVVAKCNFINASGFVYLTDTQTTAAYLTK